MCGGGSEFSYDDSPRTVWSAWLHIDVRVGVRSKIRARVDSGVVDCMSQAVWSGISCRRGRRAELEY